LALTRARAGSVTSARAEATTVASMITKFRALANAVRTGAVSSANATSRFRALTAELQNLTRQEQALVVAAVKAANAQKNQTGTTNKQSAATQRSAAGIQKQIGHTKTATTTTNKYTSALSALGKAFKRMAAYMVAGRAIMLFTQGIRAGIVEIANFDQALQNLRAITGATDTQILGMKTALIDLAQTTKFSTTELAKGMVLIGQSGFDAAESLKLIHSVATLASATLSSLETSANLLTTTLRAFNLDAIESDRVMDVMANAVTKSKLTIDKLNTAFNYVGVSASQAGLSIEETAATMMLLANNGLRASSIGTGLRQVLRRLVAPNKKLQAAFTAQNIELSRVNPTIVGYKKSLGALTSILYNARTGTVNMSRAFNLFGLRGAQSAAVIVKSFVGGKYQIAMEQVSKMGTALEMKGKQAEGLAFKFKNLGDVMKTFAIAIGDQGVAGAFKGLVDIIQGSFLAATAFMGTAIGGVTTKTLLFTGALMGAIGALKMLAALPITGPVLGWIGAFVSLATTEGLLVTTTTLLSGALAALPFAAVVTMAGLVYFALDRVANAQTRNIEKSKTYLAKVQASAAGLSTYIGALQALATEESRGVDISVKKENVINRLIEAYPELKGKIDAQKNTIVELLGVLEKLNVAYGDQQLTAMEELYKNTGKRLKENIALYDSLAGSMVNTSKIEKEIAEDRQNLETVTKGMVAQIIHMGQEQGLSNRQIRLSAEAMAVQAGASKDVAEIIKNKVIIALREQGRAQIDAAEDSVSAADMIVHNSEKVIGGINAQSSAEKQAVADYKKGLEERAQLLKSGEISADVYRQREINAQIALYTTLVKDRQKHHDALINMEGVSAETILAVDAKLLDAKQRLIELQLTKEETSYVVKLGRLKLAKEKELLTEKEFNAAKLALDIETNAALEKANDARLTQMVLNQKAQGDAWNRAVAEHNTIILAGIELRKGLRKTEQIQNIALQMESLQIDIDYYQKKLDAQIAHGQGTLEETQQLWDALNAVQAKYQALAEVAQNTYYDHNVAQLKAAYAQKLITAKDYYAEMLKLELAHYEQIVRKADVQLKALADAHQTFTDEYKKQLKIRDDARAASIAAQARFDDSEIAALKEVSAAIKSQYDLDKAELAAKYSAGERQSKAYLDAEKALYIAYVQSMIKAQEVLIGEMRAQDTVITKLNGANLRLVNLKKDLKAAVDGSSTAIHTENTELSTNNTKLQNNADNVDYISDAYLGLEKQLGLTREQTQTLMEKLEDAGYEGKHGGEISGAAWNAFAAALHTTVAALKAAISEVRTEIDKSMDHLEAWRKQAERTSFTVSISAHVGNFKNSTDKEIRAEVSRLRGVAASLSEWVTPEQKHDALETIRELEKYTRDRAKHIADEKVAVGQAEADKRERLTDAAHEKELALQEESKRKGEEQASALHAKKEAFAKAEEEHRKKVAERTAARLAQTAKQERANAARSAANKERQNKKDEKAAARLAQTQLDFENRKKTTSQEDLFSENLSDHSADLVESAMDSGKEEIAIGVNVTGLNDVVDLESTIKNVNTKVTQLSTSFREFGEMARRAASNATVEFLHLGESLSIVTTRLTVALKKVGELSTSALTNAPANAPTSAPTSAPANAPTILETEKMQEEKALLYKKIQFNTAEYADVEGQKQAYNTALRTYELQTQAPKHAISTATGKIESIKNAVKDGYWANSVFAPGSSPDERIAAQEKIKTDQQSILVEKEQAYAIVREMAVLSEKAGNLRLDTTKDNTGAIKELYAQINILADSIDFWKEGNKKIHFSKGGVVSGTGTGDTVDAKLTPNEIVLPVPVIKAGKIAEFLQGLGVNLRVPSLNV
ncbi:MAG: phage tail tape measure protein, partial [Thermoprotei archaeon]